MSSSSVSLPQNSNLGVPTPTQLLAIQSAGKRLRKKSHKSHKNHKSHKKKYSNKKGGFLGSVINQAIVPFSILGMQQTYGKNKRNKSKRRFSSKKRRNYKKTNRRY